MFKDDLSEYISSRMRERGLTYEEAAKLCGVSTSTLYNYARGMVANPNDDNLQKIAEAFGDSPDMLRQLRADSGAQDTQAAGVKQLEALRSQYAQQLADAQQNFDRDMADEKRHHRESIEAERSSSLRQTARDAQGTAYLKRLVRNLSILCLVLAALLVVAASYAFYAYKMMNG